MILQGLVLVLVCGLGSGFPQTWQFQRQLFYNPPLATLSAPGHLPQYAPAVQQPVLAKTQLQPVYIQPQQYIPATEYRQPVVYVYSPHGLQRAEVLLNEQRQQGGTYPGSSYVDNIISFFQGLGSPSQFFQPAAPTPAKPPVEMKPEKETTTSEESNSSSAENASVESPSNQNRRFMVVEQDPTRYFASPAQFVYRSHPFQVEPLNDKAGNAAISFQKYLALAKQKKIKEDEEEETDEDGALSVETDSKEASSSTTEAQTTEASDAPETSDLGPSIAQAKPQAVSVAGPGGVAAAAPVATAVVGPGGMALSAPTATAIAGSKGSSKPSITASRIKSHFKQANIPGHYFQY